MNVSCVKRFFGFVTILAVCFIVALPRADALTFNLTYDTDTPTDVVNGFNMAANLWSATLVDNITININVGLENISNPSIIGETSCSWLNPTNSSATYTSFVNALQSHSRSADDASAYAHLQSGPTYSRWINGTTDNPNGDGSLTPYNDTMNWVGITTANGKALGLTLDDPSFSASDGTIKFSTQWTNRFDYAHGLTIQSDKIDFVGAAAHEIGHLLGFSSGVDDLDSLYYTIYRGAGTNFSSNAIDFFRFSSLSLSNGLPDYTVGTGYKYFSVDGGSNAIAAFSTGVYLGDGSQASHWTNASPRVGLMGPKAGDGEKLDITRTDLRAIDVLGYSLIPEPSSFLLVLFGALLCFRGRRRSINPTG